MSVILVVQPDSLQGKVLHDVARRIGAQLVIVDSTKRAIEAIGKQIPDLILLSTLLSPREENKLMASLRTLEGAPHLQTLTLPQFRKAEEAKRRKSGFGFRKKQPAPVAAGCDPAAFAEEIVAQLARAQEIRTRPPKPAKMTSVVAAAIEPVVAPAELDQFVATPFMPDPIADVQAPEVPAFESSVFDRAESVFDLPTADCEPFVEPAPYARANFEPTNSEPTNSEPANFEPTNSEPANFEPTNFEPTNFEPTNFEPSNLEPPNLEPANFEPANFEPTNPELTNLVPASFEPVASPIAEDEIDKLVRQLGLDVRLIEIDERAAAAPVIAPGPEETFDFSAALDRARMDAEERRAVDIAHLQAEAEAIREAAVREAAVAEARAAAEHEAREALATDLARVQAEAEAMREAAITEARAAAEREARETLNAELARVRSETEVTVADALNKVKVEAEEAERVRIEAERMRVEAQEAFAAELARVRAEVEQKLTVQLEAARTEAERMRAAEAAASRERAAVEAQLKSELERLRFVSAQARKADESVTKKAGEQIKKLESELARVHAKAEERQLAELEDIKAQMAELREAAAQHVRDAAAEAVAAEVARASVQAAAVASFVAPTLREVGPKPSEPRLISLNLREAGPTAIIAQFPTREVAHADESQEEGVERLSRDYLSLWQPKPEPVAVEEPVEIEEEELEEPASIGPELRRHAKWALPVAACLLLVTSTGTAISTVARFVGPEEKAPALTVEPVNAAPFIEVVEKRVGRVRVESTPSGAEAIVDGKSYGKTPITIENLEVGGHALVLKSKTGMIRRKVTVKANETTLLTEAIFSGWLAIFAPIPVNVVIDGKPVSLTDTGRVMTSPGKHVVELINERFNYRSTETLEVRPGETTAHTASVPTGTVRVIAPDGAEVRIDGQPANGLPAEGLALAIGSHEISATHPQRGERRVAVDVRHGALTEVTLRFDQ